MQVQAFERHWQEYENTECGAEVELSAMRVPFVMHEKKRKNYRKAIYAVARVGHQIKASELYIFTKVRLSKKKFCSILIYSGNARSRYHEYSFIF